MTLQKLASASFFCYHKNVFRAGCNSRPAVTFTRKCSFHTLKEVRERKLMWCDSTTDSIVWMGEDERIALSVLMDL